MSIIKIKKVFFFPALIIGFLLSSCSSVDFDSLNMEEKLMGKWEGANREVEYVFNEDHTYYIEEKSFTESGKWFIEDSNLYYEPDGKEFVLEDRIEKLDQNSFMKSYDLEGETYTDLFNRVEQFAVAKASVQDEEVEAVNSEDMTLQLVGNWNFNDNETLTFNENNEYRIYRNGKLMSGTWFYKNGHIYRKPSGSSSLLKDKVEKIEGSSLIISYMYKGKSQVDNYSKDENFTTPFPIDQKTDYEYAREIGQSMVAN